MQENRLNEFLEGNSIKKLILIGTILLFMCQPALAKELRGWGATTWGMSEQEVLKLYKDDVTSSEEITNAIFKQKADRIVLLKQRDVAGLPMSVRLDFKDGELVSTHLHVDKYNSSSRNFTNLKNLLTKKYGSSDSNDIQYVGGKPHVSYTWLLRSTTIELRLATFSDRKRLVISYSPTPDAEGL